MIVAPTILCDDPFPRSVFHRRHPAVFRQMRAAVPYGPGQLARLGELLAETTGGVVKPLADEGSDTGDWAGWNRPHLDRPWGETPFLWAESYFYRRILSAIGYFGDGAWHGFDPFGPTKAADLASAAVEDELAALDRVPVDASEVFLLSALWGNHADLGFQLVAGPDVPGSGLGDLLVDDGPRLWELLDGGTVCLVADNASRELLPDLVLLDHLLRTGRASDAVILVKPRPYYVSDATTADVVDAVGRLAAASGRAGEAGRRLREAVGTGRLVIGTHPFFCAPLSYHDMPAGLRETFAGASITIMKGDLNYRRLVGDRLWPAATPFAEVAGYFPGPVAALRTLKSDVVTGLDPDVVAGLEASGEGWRTEGTRAVLQVTTGARSAGA